MKNHNKSQVLLESIDVDDDSVGSEASLLSLSSRVENWKFN